MKKIGVFIVSFFMVFWAGAQDIEILNAPGKVHYGGIGDEVRVPLLIRNNSTQPIHVFVKRAENNIGSTQSSSFCLGNDCYDKTVEKLPISKRIEPGEVMESFVSVLKAGLVGGVSSITYEVYSRDNPTEVVKYEVNYEITEVIQRNTLFTSDDITLNEVYPNPVKEYAFIDYQMNNEDIEVKILIHNVLGSVVGEFMLNPKEKELKIPTLEYNPGVYFYTLSIDGDGVITKKLVIRR